MIFDVTETHRYRESTVRYASTPGITVPYRLCCECGKQSTTLKKVAGTGSSRHNPLRWKCKEHE